MSYLVTEAPEDEAGRARGGAAACGRSPRGDASPALPRKRAEDVPVRAGCRAHLGFRLVSAAPLPYSSPAFPAGLRSTSV